MLAGRRVRLSFAGEHFERQLLRALAIEPLAGDVGGAPALDVRCWDARSSGVRLAGPWWRGANLTPAGVVEELSDDRHQVSLDVHGALASILDRETGEAYHYVPDPARLPAWETTHPARILLATWARDGGLVTCHAAAVADGAGGLLLCGGSGAGKSTTALGALAAGMRSAGDDYVLVEPRTRPVVHALYRSTLLELDHYQRHSELMPVLDHIADQITRRKAVMFAGEGGTPRIGGSFALVALVALRVAPGATPGYASASAATVLRALAPSTLAQLGMIDAAGLARLVDLCRRLPTYQLTLGDDPSPIPDLLRALIGEAGERPVAAVPAMAAG